MQIVLDTRVEAEATLLCKRSVHYPFDHLNKRPPSNTANEYLTNAFRFISLHRAYQHVLLTLTPTTYWQPLNGLYRTLR